MKLQIITTQKITEHDIEWIELNTPAGNMVILYGHAPMIIELSSGYELLYKIKNSVVLESMIIIQGFAHVSRDGVKILLPIDL